MHKFRAAIPVLGLLVGALALWGSSRAPWVRVTVEAEQFGTVQRELSGAHWAPEVVALALGVLAGGAVYLFTRGTAARVVAAVAFCLAALAALPGAQLLTVGGDSARAHSIITSQDGVARTSGTTRAGQIEAVPEWATVTSVDSQAAGPGLSIAGALLAMAGALVGVVKPKAAPAKGDKYRTPAQLREAAAAGTSLGTETESAPLAVNSASSGEAAERHMPSNQKSEQSHQDADRLLWDSLDSGDDPTDDAPTN